MHTEGKRLCFLLVGQGFIGTNRRHTVFVPNLKKSLFPAEGQPSLKELDNKGIKHEIYLYQINACTFSGCSFQDIKDARMAFQLYEHMDNAGLVINDRLMMRTLKLCGRTISQIKLMQHVSV